jgi:hypothetical protein
MGLRLLAFMIQDERTEECQMSNVSKTNRTIKLNFASDTEPPARKLAKSL